MLKLYLYEASIVNMQSGTWNSDGNYIIRYGIDDFIESISQFNIRVKSKGRRMPIVCARDLGRNEIVGCEIGDGNVFYVHRTLIRQDN